MMKRFLIILVMLFWCSVGFTSELIKIPVHVHILEIDEKGYKTKAKPKHIESYFKKANKVWAKANIFWDVKKINYVPAATEVYKQDIKWLKKNVKNNSYAAEERRHWFYSDLLQTKLHQKHGAINVYYLPYLFSANCGISYRRGSQPDPSTQFVMMVYKMNPKFRFICPRDKHWHGLAHELGHQLHLAHEKRSGFLMAVGAKKGKKFREEDLIKVMEFYKNYLKEYLEQY